MKQMTKTKELNTAEAINKIRTEKGITMQDLSEASGISISAICRYEKGARAPRMDSFTKLMDALDTEILLTNK